MNVQPDDGPVDRGHNQHRESAAVEALLRFHVLVACKKHVEALPLDQREQRAVFDAAPFHADDSLNIVLRQKAHQFAWHILVEENLQRCACN